MKKSHILLLLVLFIFILSISRVLWMEVLRDRQEAHIQNGLSDLRHWDARQGDILLLDGEWEFYPYQWLMDRGNMERNSIEEGRRILQYVPGGWNQSLDDENPTPYGFGSYRLRIQVDPDQDLNYSMQLTSVRSASELYVNGRLLAQSGQVAETKEEYSAKNVPYSAVFTADEDGIIEIIVQAANYADNRGSGIVRSIKFGSEAAIAKEIKFSVSMQLVGALIFLVHSIYTFILYLLGNREKKLLYFSLLTLCVTLTTLLSHDEKLFHQFFYIGSTWDFRIANIALVIGFYALLECTDHHNLPIWRRLHSYYRALSLGTAGIILVLLPHQIITIFPLFFLLVSVATVITIRAVFKKIFEDIQNQILLLLSILAMIHHFLWAIIWRQTGLSVIHYPFDLIIAMGCFSSVWFKNYFNMHASTKRLAETLQRMNEHKDQFLANTSHEFKNPLHGILNLSQSVLKREGQSLQERSVKELETVLSVGQRLTLILNDLIDVMSLREGNPRLHKQAISIQPLVTGVMDMLQFNAEVKNVRMSNQIPGDFPLVLADENRVIQIVFNLLHNAVKFTNEGSVTVQAAQKDGRAYITVEDTGIGMDKEMLERMFLPYEQASSQQTMIEGGFGLGLSISKQLVELHGGELEVASVLGKGSTLTFSLELADSYSAAENEAEADLLQSNPFPLLKPVFMGEKASNAWQKTAYEANTEGAGISFHKDRPLILLVDDDPVNLQVLEATLPAERYEVSMVTSGKEAVSMLDKKDWDLVVTDVMMPQMSGYELTRIIRQRFTLTELPVLLLTARSQPQDIQSGFMAGANDYVTKPVEALEIRSRVGALITMKRGVQEKLRLEAAWLQAQIQPHFLYNALTAVASLSETDLDKMHSLLHEFSSFLRSKFQFQNMDEPIPVEEELSLVRSYLYIEKVRFEDKLQVEWEIDDCKDLKVPFLSIQPLVENAIRHGVMKRTGGGKIVIRIAAYETHVTISVEDDGVGMDEAQLQRLLERKVDSGSGVGLINTDQRLRRHFGAGLHITSMPDEGTSVSFTVPLLAIK